MSEWYLSLEPFLQVLYGVAIISTALFLFKGILLVFGISGTDTPIDSDGALDDISDFDADAGVRYFSIVGILSFLSVGSWGAILGLTLSQSHIIAICAGIAAGTAEMIAVARLVRFLRRLQESGNVRTEHAIGKIGEVYLSIPPIEHGTGKVNLVINSGLKEFQAVSLDKTVIPTGTKVRIVDIQNDNTLVVQRVSEELA